MFRRCLRNLVPMAAGVAALAVLTPAALGARQDQLPTARQIVDRSIQAAGGADAFKAVKSMHATGTISIPTQNLTGDVEVWTARPNKSVTHGTMTGIGKIDEGYDGKVGWTIDPMSGPALLTGKALVQRADDAWFDAPLHAPDHVKDLTLVGRDTFDKRAVYRVKVTLLSGTEMTEFFDVETGLHIGTEATHETPMGSIPTRSIFRDHKKFGALTLPGTEVEQILGIEQVVTFTSYDFNGVPPATFDLPAVIKALIK